MTEAVITGTWAPLRWRETAHDIEMRGQTK
jgi:hypothetical protein